MIFNISKSCNYTLFKCVNNRFKSTIVSKISHFKYNFNKNIPDYDLEANPYLIYKNDIPDYDLEVNPHLIYKDNIPDYDLEVNPYLIPPMCSKIIYL